jgi:CRISPR type I-E-associated protein CasB/Cse2
MTVRQKGETLLKMLESLTDNRGAMASLRRAANPNLESGCWPFLGPVVSLQRDREYEVARCVASSYALHPKVGNNKFAYTLRVISNFGSDKGIDARFIRLLSIRNNIPLLTDKVQQLIKRVKKEGVAIDYVSMYEDMFYWSDIVRRRWAHQYWGSEEKKGES